MENYHGLVGYLIFFLCLLQNADATNSTTNTTDCGVNVDIIANGVIELLDPNNTTYGALARVICDDGFEAVPLILSCLSTGVWDNATCEPIECGNVPDIYDGSITLSDSGNMSYGATANVTCDLGYSASVPTIICLETGYWEVNVTCDIIGCGPVPTLSHGDLILSGAGNASYGATAEALCVEGYAPSSSNITCLASGDWENVTCDIIGCGPVPTLSNGKLILSEAGNVSVGAVANATCDEGYAPSYSYITCLTSGNWENVTCYLTGCGPVPNVSNGDLVLSETGNVSYGATAEAFCVEGYAPSSSNITCLGSGDWENVTCDIIGCGQVPTIGNGDVILSEAGNSSFWATAEPMCIEGYVPSSPNITCLPSGKWENVTCDIIACGPVPTLSHGDLILSEAGNVSSEAGNVSYGATAEALCVEGYAPSSSNITCLASGDWENVTCDIIGCGPVPTLSKGELILSEAGNVSFGAYADATCDEGYAPSYSYITCLTSGNWENVTCYLTGCGPVPTLSNGDLILFEAGNFSFGAVADATCDEGYAPSYSYITCLTSGNWENVTCYLTGCGQVPIIGNGNVILSEAGNSSFWATAEPMCIEGYVPSSPNITCLPSGKWENVTCDIIDCGAVPNIPNGDLVVSGSSTFEAIASVDCDLGFTSNVAHVTCLSSGLWEDTAVCTENQCSVNSIPSIANGQVSLEGDANQTTASWANVSCDGGFAATSPVIECQENGEWQNDVACVAYELGYVLLVAGQDFPYGIHTAFMKCSFLIADGLTYKIKWIIDGVNLYETSLLSSAEAAAVILTDDLYDEAVDAIFQSQLFGVEVVCNVTVLDGHGITEYQSRSSPGLTPVRVSTQYIVIERGEEATFTIYYVLPFGCPTGTAECFLRFILYDPSDSYLCDDSTVTVVDRDTCGGKIEGVTQGTTDVIASSGSHINITITTKNDRWYRLRSNFTLILTMRAVGNNKVLWNRPFTYIVVQVVENPFTRGVGCYSYVDPYIWSFDGRWFSMQLVGEFIMMRLRTLPIEVQTITAPCGRGMTCSCAVTVRAGGDVFTIDHCQGHFMDYLSYNDGILRVYRLSSTYYLIILPTGMEVYVYVMPYLYYMMNVYIIPTPGDFEQMDGLCGNFNGDFSDDTLLRGTNIPSSAEASYPGGSVPWWWWWYSDYMRPYDFAYSWELLGTGRSDESLQNPNVYNNVGSWDDAKKLCVCPYANTGNFVALCSANEEATCVNPVVRYGTLISATSRAKRSVDGDGSYTDKGQSFKANRLKRMRDKWLETTTRDHNRKKRQVTNDTVLTFDEAKQICETILTSDCHAYTKKDDVSALSNTTDNLDNCAMDVMVDNDISWLDSHCTTVANEITTELERDQDFSDNNPVLADDIKNNACYGSCGDHGTCVNKVCVCDSGFATDLCLLNITVKPLLEEAGDAGVCDVTTDTCDYVIVVGDGFVETPTCRVGVYEAGMNGSFIQQDIFDTIGMYVSFNEVSVPTSSSVSTSRRRRQASSTTSAVATMVEVSVSNDGSHFSSPQYVVILDGSCQQSGTDDNGATIITTQTGYCYIDGTCYTSDTFMTNSACLKCDTNNALFNWTDGCDNSGDDSDMTLVIILSSVGGAVFIAAVVIVIIIVWHKKVNADRIMPLVDVPSKMRFWLRQDSVTDVETRLGGATGGRKSAAE